MASAVIISIDGADNSGKSSHTRLLASSLQSQAEIGRSIHHYLDDWSSLPFNSPAWWFHEYPSVSLTTLMFRSYVARRQALDQTNSEAVVTDRGILTVTAACAATQALKDEVPIEQAIDEVLALRRTLIVNDDHDALTVLLTNHALPTEAARISIERAESPSDEYAQYQHLLQLALRILTPKDAHIVDTSECSFLEAHNEVRKVFSEHAIRVPPLLSRVPHVFLFGGLSESGKSTATEYLRIRHGFVRLKLAYLFANARQHDLTEIARLSPWQQSLFLLEELDRFSTLHKHDSSVTLESLHSSSVGRVLKTILGNRLSLVYVDCPLTDRLERSTLGPQDVSQRDEEKESRGASEVRDLADNVIDNSGDRLELAVQLDILARPIGRFQPCAKGYRELAAGEDMRNFAGRVLERARSTLGEDLLLFAVTGSVAMGEKQYASDLDVLMIATSGATGKLASVDLRKPGEPKLGVTVLTEGEVERGMVAAAGQYWLLHVIAGTVSPQWVAAGYSIPIITGVAQARRSWQELPHNIHLLRRELILHRDETRIAKLLKLCRWAVSEYGGERTHSVSASSLLGGTDQSEGAPSVQASEFVAAFEKLYDLRQ